MAPASWGLDPACTIETVEHLQQRVASQLKLLRNATLSGSASADAFIGGIRQPLQLAHNYSNKQPIGVEASEPFYRGNDLLVSYTDPDDGTTLISCGEANKYGHLYGGADINSHVTSILNLKSANPHKVNNETVVAGDYKLRLGGNGGDKDSVTLRVSGVTSFATYRDTHRHRTLNPSVPIVLPTVIASMWEDNNCVNTHCAQEYDSFISPWFSAVLRKLRRDHIEHKGELTTIIDGFFHTFKQLLNEISSEGDLVAMFEENNLRYADFPLATRIPYTLTGTAKNFLHFLQLRAGETVHPELRYDIYDIIKRNVSLVVYAGQRAGRSETYPVPLPFWLAAYTDWNQENWRRFNRNTEILKHSADTDLYLLTPSTRRGKQNIK